MLLEDLTSKQEFKIEFKLTAFSEVTHSTRPDTCIAIARARARARYRTIVIMLFATGVPRSCCFRHGSFALSPEEPSVVSGCGRSFAQDAIPVHPELYVFYVGILVLIAKWFWLFLSVWIRFDGF